MPIPPILRTLTGLSIQSMNQLHRQHYMTISLTNNALSPHAHTSLQFIQSNLNMLEMKITVNLRDRDNLRRKDKRPVPKVSFVRRFNCISCSRPLAIIHSVYLYLRDRFPKTGWVRDYTQSTRPNFKTGWVRD